MESADAALARRGRTAVSTARFSTVATRIICAAPPEAVWRSLLFYEEVGERPPLLLRLLLPVPIRTEGKKAKVGAEARCIYEGGYLIKRLTLLDAPHRYEFEVSEQALPVGRGMRLSGGRYVLEPTPDGGTLLRVETRYHSPKRPRFFWAPIESAVCHAFHRYLLRTIRRRAEAPKGSEETPCPS